MLRILGKYKDNDGWYFIDYCDTVYDVGHIFENGEEILEIKDQFMYNNRQTKVGWQFICKMKNVDDTNLQSLETWDFVKNIIELE